MDKLNNEFPEDLKYTFESTGNLTNRVYTEEFARAYNKQTNDIVEEKMKQSIYLTACLWYTAWVNAGQPELI